FNRDLQSDNHTGLIPRRADVEFQLLEVHPERAIRIGSKGLGNQISTLLRVDRSRCFDFDADTFDPQVVLSFMICIDRSIRFPEPRIQIPEMLFAPDLPENPGSKAKKVEVSISRNIPVP
ncbi:MAG TPA: hypothetical protein PLG59_08140, partial [bacterium]|nr:hypothetical protein [bacterium]